ncbi:MAG: chitobiase/beta-hexosaminidase C-terminal domain-containing protein [Candidatus Cloacimonetes bacterium]|nr:chitobiase/beta-hexosaminidase C-terminal domain-containing protein [Candidatus Cloacimonadota bacterium]
MVTITCETDRTNIYYTVDGTEPTKSSTPYQSPISINSTTTLKAKAFDSWNELIPFESFISSATYTINLPAVATPSISLASGTYTGIQTTTISCSTSGASIHYTTDGTDPTETSSQYSSPISVQNTTTLSAKAFKASYNPSSTVTATYTFNLPTVATPTFNPTGGTYTSPKNVTISCFTSGATIRYTTNGTNPNATSAQYTGTISVTATTTLNAKAFKTGYNDSAVATAIYTFAGSFTENFESYANFAKTFAPWTLVDIDQSATYGIQDYSWPNAYEEMAYIIFNPSATTPPISGGDAHSGSKYAASFAATSPPNNDWMISPTITPQAGAFLSFWARSYTASYGLERFKVGISRGGTSPANFTIISGNSYVQAPEIWTQFNYDLSAYAGQSIRFGIQCVSDDAFYFMIDDVSVQGGPAKLTNQTTPIQNMPVKTVDRALAPKKRNVK